ncbi:38112_t:CDS:2 [Gigaspora margarita]|uniref:38112_t:CDS:1 n=1 Tax=Gigaspora margarita TaxID=4874 RepID=A0ABN7WXG4_GIGMA|nr:38112_t:CDS:2 [Gigaspora margarita]
MGTSPSKYRKDVNCFDTISQYILSVTGVPKKFDREEEQAGLRHCIVRELFNGNFSSPIRNELNLGSLRVLDIGCGFGTWMFEMSSDFQKCHYVGVDITPQYFIVNKPKNVDFINANINNGLPFHDESFDFIHIRHLVYDLQDNEWDSLIRESITETEMVTKNVGPSMAKLIKKVVDLLNVKKIGILIVDRIEEVMKSNNLQNIVRYERNFPIGTWNNDLGDAFPTYTCDTLRNALIRFNDPKDIDNELKKFITEANLYRTYFSLHKFVLQKT